MPCDRTIRIAYRLAVLVVAAMLGSCAPALTTPTPLAEVLAADRAAASEPYRLQPGDQLEIRHLVHTDLSTLALVQPDGMINVPGLPDQVHAAGLSTDELTEELMGLYIGPEGKLANPNFSVLLRTAPSQRVFVGGEVARPGYLELQGVHSVLQAVVAAGGLLPTARGNEIVVIRGGPGGRRMAFALDLDKAMHGRDLSQDVPLHPLDIVVVPRSHVAALDAWVDQYIRQALPVPGSASVSYQTGSSSSTTVNTTTGGTTTTATPAPAPAP